MIAAVFPGQGSQKPGMGKELFQEFEEARYVFESVSRATGIDSVKLCFETDEETLRQTQNAQLALYTCGVAAYESLRARLPDGVKIEAMAGHSVGEYAALAAARVVSIATGATLVKRRGEVMSEAGRERPGTMAAVLGIEREALEKVCREADGVVVVANDNCPGQLVISGEVDAVAKAGEIAQAKGAKRVLPLNVSGAFHSPLMEGPAIRFAETLDPETFSLGEASVYANTTGEPAVDAERWPRMLEDQLRSPVRWTESVQAMIHDGVDTFIECGAGEVLSGLIKRISREVRTLRVSDPASLEETVKSLTV
jgi:[acyl-carrier-protein] S-malonyltransferase